MSTNQWLPRKQRLKLGYLKRFLQLIRVQNLLLIACSQFLLLNFVIFNDPIFVGFVFPINGLLMICSTFSIAAAGYIINDYYDIKIDYLNKPNDVIIGKSIQRRTAIFLHSLLNFVGVALAFFVGVKVGLITFLCGFLLFAYSNQLKRLAFIGNLSVAFLAGVSILEFAVIYSSNKSYIFAYAIFAFFVNLIREVIKDIEDMVGDEVHGCRTLPIVYGVRNTKAVIYVVSAILLSLVFTINTWNTKLSFNIFFLIIGVFFVFFVYKLINADKKKDFTFLSQFLKIIILIGIVSMVFL